jgi:creatinine amidohydrolase/Fe(II)-dependent formamide hydrolase-like protein
MGVSSREKHWLTTAKRTDAACADAAAEGFGSRILRSFNPPITPGNQALALLSAVRSERSA